jgi:hypothetical protein
MRCTYLEAMQVKRVWIGLCALTIMSQQVEAQRPRRQAGSTVEGDVYLLMKSGDTKKGAGLTIFLRPQTDDLIAELRAICAKYERMITSTRFFLIGCCSCKDPPLPGGPEITRYVDALVDSAERLHAAQKPSAARSIRAKVTARPGLETGTGMNAHYKFEKVPPGEYFLFGEWKIGDNNYQWWAPIELLPGTVLKKDLDNSVEADGLASCEDAI